MTIRCFDSWASGGQRTQTFPLSILKDCRMGIDVEKYVQSAFGGVAREPLLDALGGFPNGLRETLIKDLDNFHHHGITPVWVFSGCSIARTEKPFTVPDDSAKARAAAWELYDKGLGTEAVEAFSKVGMQAPSEMYRAILKLFREEHVDFQVAPYSAWPQLAYLNQKEYIDCIYGETELLLFDVDKIINRLDFESKEFSFVTKQRLRNDLGGLTEGQFIDACLLAGSQLCRTFPPLDAANNSFIDAVGLVKKYRAIGNAITSHPDQSAYLDRFRKARAAIQHHVIMNEAGHVEQMDLANSPSDVHEFIGQRLPEELYFYLSRGVLGPQMLEMLTTGEFIEKAPLDCNESDEYKKFLDGINVMRTQSLSILSKFLHRYWNTRDVKVYNWFDSKNPKTLRPKEIECPSEKAQKWNVREKVFLPVMDAQEKQWGEFGFCLTSLVDEEFAASTITPKDPANILETTYEIRINALWRMQQMRGFIDGKTHQLTSWGRALVASINALSFEDEGLIQALYVGFELFRMKALTSKNFVPSFSGAPANGSDQDKANTLIISRFCSLYVLDHKPVGYAGPLNRNILAFSSFSSTLLRELRNFTEMTLANLLLAGDANRERENPDDWASLGLKLPFIDEPNATLGIVAKTYLDDLNSSDDKSLPARKALVGVLEGYIPNATGIQTDLEIGFTLFSAFVTGIKVLADDLIMKEEADALIAANEWLMTRKFI